ncbi:MAG: glycosyltransferase family 4 protein [Bacteroidetes bacterium]|nr:glycosyltransferase family 4 protein [Bacteroidota bacterium]
MKITISVGGRFHAFYLARFFHEQGVLDKLITSYPSFEVKKYGIPASKVRSVWVKEVAQRSWKILTGKFPPEILTANLYDYIASVLIPKKSDAYVIWSSYGEKTIREIRKKNQKAVIFLERSSAHIEIQQELLFKTVPAVTIHPSIIKKELSEYQNSNYISLISQFARRTFIEKGVPESKLIINHLGVNLEVFRYNPTRELPAVFTVGYVGSMSAQKNVRGLISAVGNLVNQGFKIKLLLVGGIDDASFDQSLLKNTAYVDYKGSVPEKQLPFFYSQMDIFVLNTIQDGFGMVILQALSSGIPVIATENSGGPDVITEGKNGFIIPAFRDDLLEVLLKNCLENRDSLSKMGPSARNTVISGFSWEDYGNRFLETIKNHAS